MALHNIKGKDGERYARDYLGKRGMCVCMWNWRSGHHEIDIIATGNGIVHFIEVKTRCSLKYGYPEEAVTKKKFRCLKIAAAAFLGRYMYTGRIQFDILSILMLKDKPAEFLLFEDVYI